MIPEPQKLSIRLVHDKIDTAPFLEGSVDWLREELSKDFIITNNSNIAVHVGVHYSRPAKDFEHKPNTINNINDENIKIVFPITFTTQGKLQPQFLDIQKYRQLTPLFYTYETNSYKSPKNRGILEKLVLYIKNS